MTTDFYTSCETIVREAGMMIHKADITGDNVHQKDGLANFVTDFDVEVQQFLFARFRELLPDASFYGEEDTEGNEKSADSCGNGYCFYIDPIDGTTNFIFGYQHSCVSVGLALDGQIIAGYVYNPYTDTMYKAVRGEGAYCVQGAYCVEGAYSKKGAQGAYCNERKLVVSDKSIAEGIVAFGCARYNEGDTDLLFAAVKELYLHSLSVRNGGSAALDLCRVAAGANVTYLELKLQPYDYAAASVIIEEAGGEIRQVEGEPITLDKPCSILAGTRTACNEVRNLIKSLK